jgi:hypothetical protein
LHDDILQTDKKRSHWNRCLSTKAYEEEVPVAVAKYNDLKECAMPREHHTFYKSLTRSAIIPNVLPQPDAQTKPRVE